MFLAVVNDGVVEKGILDQLMNSELSQLMVTILSGVFVYVLSQLFAEFLLRPIQEYKKLKGKVAKYLVLYACYYSNPQAIGDNKGVSKWENASDVIRELASEVTAFAETKPHGFWVWYSIPRKKVLQEVSRSLIGLSNSFFDTKSCLHECRENTRNLVEEIKKDMKIARR